MERFNTDFKSYISLGRVEEGGGRGGALVDLKCIELLTNTQTACFYLVNKGNTRISTNRLI